MDGAQCARAHEFTTGLILTQTLAMQITNLETVFCRFPQPCADDGDSDGGDGEDELLCS